MTLAICLVAITPLQCSCLHSTHADTHARTQHTRRLCHCGSPRAVLVTAQLYCITLTWQQKKTLCIGPAEYRRGMDPRINYTRDRLRVRASVHARTHTRRHTAAAFSLASHDIFRLPVKAMTERQTEQQDAADTLMLFCMLEAYSNSAELWL